MAVVFLSAGGRKLAGDPAMRLLFEQIGLGGWFGYFTGAVEIVGGVLLLAPRGALLGSLLLCATMIGATLVNLTVAGIAQPALKAAVAVALLAASAFVAWRSRPRGSRKTPEDALA